MRTLLFSSLATACLLASSAGATIIKTGGKSNCTMKENVTVGINFNLTAASIADAKVQYDKKLAAIADIAGELKITKLEPHSMNYNINKQNQYGGDSAYRINGRAQYKMTSSEVAFKFASMLEKHNLSPNINSNSRRQGNCK